MQLFSTTVNFTRNLIFYIGRKKRNSSFIIINGDVKISVEGKTTFRGVLALLRSREEYRGQLIDTNRKQREFYQDSWPSILSGYLQVITVPDLTERIFFPIAFSFESKLRKKERTVRSFTTLFKGSNPSEKTQFSRGGNNKHMSQRSVGNFFFVYFLGG